MPLRRAQPLYGIEKNGPWAHTKVAVRYSVDVHLHFGHEAQPAVNIVPGPVPAIPAKLLVGSCTDRMRGTAPTATNTFSSLLELDVHVRTTLPMLQC
jgi:hypothetical protein